jgi:hypothetical protein
MNLHRLSLHISKCIRTKKYKKPKAEKCKNEVKAKTKDLATKAELEDKTKDLATKAELEDKTKDLYPFQFIIYRIIRP